LRDGTTNSSKGWRPSPYSWTTSAYTAFKPWWQLSTSRIYRGVSHYTCNPRSHGGICVIDPSFPAEPAPGNLPGAAFEPYAVPSAILAWAGECGDDPFARLTCHIVDFAALPSLPPVDEVYLALGTTIKVAGSQAAFRAVDFEANLAVARAALAAGARRCGLVSAMGANTRSRVFYSRVKGELEDALAKLPFEGLVIARPLMLTGDREAIGQPERRVEKAFMVVSKILGSLIPANYRAIAAAQVAQALLAQTPAVEGRVVLLSAKMQRR
jgi:hypothetical protein